MTLAILGIVAAILPLLVRWIGRRMDVAADPETKKTKETNELNRQVVKEDHDALNADFADDLRRLQDLSGGQRGSGAAPGEGGGDIHPKV